MALGKSQKVIEDVGSEELRLLRQEFNKLLDSVDALVEGLAGAADVAAINTLAAGIDTTALRKIVTTLERPAAPRIATV